MHIEWAVLGQVVLVSVLLTVALVGLFSVGIRTGSATSRTRPAGYLSFALCAAAVGYGIFIVAT
ncbi:hypothetical protein [Streptomyces litchfieldiae]|uniref:Secreted protein n=1 Tax=Streptomyces litchfieldiae TaxID=3075543 RepID=A0ABU2MT87_9ACTN|nr:hypothetical protein [Streptomyces sp. DSM 44938]MDT0344853.1 hypothetical protein [Streptomyces sp. DSM 44938]